MTKTIEAENRHAAKVEIRTVVRHFRVFAHQDRAHMLSTILMTKTPNSASTTPCQIIPVVRRAIATGAQTMPAPTAGNNDNRKHHQHRSKQ